MGLSDILRDAGGVGDLADLWSRTDAAGEMGPLPAGEYVAHIVGGDLETSRTRGTPGYRLTFEVFEGQYAGRKFWHDCWLTPAAIPQSKRDLGKLGITALEQLDRPLPRGIRCRAKLALRRDDDGNEHNRVRSFEVIGIDPPKADPFAPPNEVPNPDSTAHDPPAPPSTEDDDLDF